MTMGQWKKRVLVKGQRSSQTRSTKARPYLAIPPVEGWKGGHPSENGYRRSGK